MATTLTTAADGKSAIFVMKSDGTGVRRLATVRHFDRFPGNLAWSPDSGTIAFVTSPSFDCSAIALLDVRTGRQRPLTSCSGIASSADSPAWQPSTG